jgi:hypothetical protein
VADIRSLRGKGWAFQNRVVATATNGGRDRPSAMCCQEQTPMTSEKNRTRMPFGEAQIDKVPEPLPRSAPALTRTPPGGCQAGFLNCGSPL